MKTTLYVLATLTLGAGGLSSCATVGDADSDSMAVMCPSCETVWVRDSRYHPKQTRVYSMSREMRCPGCDTNAKAFLEDGKLVLHNCPQCKVTPTVATPRPTPTVGSAIKR